MAEYRIKNGSHLDKAFKVHGGFAIVKSGATQTVDTLDPISEERVDAFAAEGVKITEKGKAEPAEKAGATEKGKANG
jgi:hypothetical protein